MSESELAVVDPPSRAIETIPEPPRTFIARTSTELAQCQAGLMVWVDRRIIEVQAEYDEAAENHCIAIANNFRPAAWTKIMNMAKRRLDYYDKIKAALAAGYVLVPNLAIDLFAVRTSREAPRRIGATDSTWRARKSPETVTPEPAGQGRYVSNEAEMSEFKRVEDAKDWQGKPVKQEHTDYWAEDFKDVDFPLDVAKPMVMENTATAMEMKVFDEIGVARDQRQRLRGDPIVIGHIRDPRPNRPGLSFFIAWCFDVAAL